jgi:CRISPR/Cas system-associated protein endoribonuclease Cas2
MKSLEEIRGFFLVHFSALVRVFTNQDSLQSRNQRIRKRKLFR